MLRVLYLINHAGRGGTERYVRSLAERLKSGETEIFFAYNEPGLLVDNMKELGIPIYRLEMKSRFDLKAASGLAELCGKLKIDIVHTQFLRENYIALMSKIYGNRASIINTCHILHVSTVRDKFLNRLFPIRNRKVIAVSHAAERFLIRQGVGRKKIRVIHNGVDVDYFSENCGSGIRAELGISENSTVAVSIGRFSREKGHFFLIRSIKRMLEMGTEKGLVYENPVVFLLVGDGELLEECRKLSAELGVSEHIIFAGYRTDVRNILKGSDVYICHSESETFPISVLEAISCSLPVITTKVGGTGEIVNDETKCGVTVEYDDVDGLAQAMNLLLTDGQMREQYGKCGLKAAKENFSITKMVSETYNIYKDCV